MLVRSRRYCIVEDHLPDRAYLQFAINEFPYSSKVGQREATCQGHMYCEDPTLLEPLCPLTKGTSGLPSLMGQGVDDSLAASVDNCLLRNQ